MAQAPNVYYAYLAQKLEAGGSETTVYLDRITTVTGETIVTADFATFSRGILTINPDGTTDSPPEYVSFTAVDATNIAVTGVTRGLSARSNSQVTANILYHPVGTPVAITFGTHNLQDMVDYVDAQVAAAAIGTATVATGTAGETLVDGNVVYLKVADSKWWKADASTAATCEGVQLGIVQGAASADAACTVLIAGRATNLSGLTANNTYYISDTAGAIATSAGTFSKAIGVARAADELYFEPNYTNLPTASESNYLAATTGMIVMYGGSSAPTGFLLCDGSAVSRTTYSALFAVVSTAFGAGDGSTTFNVPDLRSSFPLGKGQRVETFDFVDGDVDTGTDVITVDENYFLYTGQAVVASTTGTLPAGLSPGTYYVIRASSTTIKLASSVANANAGTQVDITAAAGGGTHTLTLTLTDRSVGDTGGEETHALTDAEMPSHVHTNAPGTGYAAGGGTTAKGDDGTTDPAGSDSPHNNMPPYTTVNYVIKT